MSRTVLTCQVATYTYGACAGAFPTNVALPLSLSRSMAWNCTGAVMTSSTDENSKTSYINYSTDPYFWRPESTKDQLLNITNLSYASLIQSRGHLDFNGGTPSSTVDVTSTLDSLGFAIPMMLRRPRARALGVFALVSISSLLVACGGGGSGSSGGGGGGGTLPGSYTIIAKASSGNLNHNISLTLNVN
jgi:hypothetical protein